MSVILRVTFAFGFRLKAAKSHVSDPWLNRVYHGKLPALKQTFVPVHEYV